MLDSKSIIVNNNNSNTAAAAAVGNEYASVLGSRMKIEPVICGALHIVAPVAAVVANAPPADVTAAGKALRNALLRL